MYNNSIISLVALCVVFLFILEDFKFSYSNITYRVLQRGLSLLIIYFIYIIYTGITILDHSILCIKADLPSTEGTVNVQNPTVSVSTDGAKAIAKSYSTIGSSIGLSTTIAGITGGVAKVIAKSSLPFLQKAGVVIGGAVAGGAIHSGFSAINISLSANQCDSNGSSSGNIPKSVNNFWDNGDASSPLTDLLSSIETLSLVSLSLLVIFCANMIFRYYLKDNFKLNLSHIFGASLNAKFNEYIIKLIHINRKLVTIIWLLLL